MLILINFAIFPTRDCENSLLVGELNVKFLFQRHPDMSQGPLRDRLMEKTSATPEKEKGWSSIMFQQKRP